MAAPTAVASRPPLRTTMPSQFGSVTSGPFAPPPVTQTQTQPPGLSFTYGPSPVGERHEFMSDSIHRSFVADGDGGHTAAATASSVYTGSAILIRKLARNMTSKELRSMFLFAKDFLGSDFFDSDVPEDRGYLSAVARFKSMAAAEEAKAMLDGKPNTAMEANMMVDILPGLGPMMSNPPRRNTVDGTLNRVSSNSTSSSSGSLVAANARQPLRYNPSFQGLDRMSSPVAAHGIGPSDFPFFPPASRIQSLFMPKSPVGAPTSEPPRVSGKSVINDDSVDDDETGELLKDPVAYAKNGHQASAASRSRRPTNPQVPVARFASLSLTTTTNLPPASVPAFVSAARTGPPTQGSVATLSPVTMNHVGPPPAPSNYPLAAQPFQPRPNYPPVNPADQNPPCNTLYVGNLPIDTSEDELKAMFSKQRGYKRLCFRTKQNGPMCFVEFEDVSFATKALNELYGHMLHNSVKGGIRLSFSKNPLGVRTGQSAGPSGMSLGMRSHAAVGGLKGAGLGSILPAPFHSASGPPPGLVAPPGLQGPANYNAQSLGPIGASISGSGVGGGLSNGTFSMAPLNGNVSSASMAELKSISSVGGGVVVSGPGGSNFGSIGGALPDYMLGR